MNHWEANRTEHPAACTCSRCNRERIARLPRHPEDLVPRARARPGRVKAQGRPKVWAQLLAGLAVMLGVAAVATAVVLLT